MHQVIKLRARQRRAAAHNCDLLGNCQAWDNYHDDLSKVPTLKAEKRVAAWCNSTVAEIDDPTVRVKYGVVNSRGTIVMRVSCDCAIWVRPKRAKSPSRGAAANSIVLETKNWDCCAGQLQGGDGFAGVVNDANQVVVKAVIVRRGRIGESCCD